MTDTPIIILVRPQLVENIGTAARAMLNCGLTRLRLVSPRDPWPTEGRIRERLYAAAVGADAVLDGAGIFDDLRAALNDLHHVYATTARDHAMVKSWHTPRAAMPAARQRIADGQKIGLMFGPERTGLTLDDMSCVNEVIAIPANPAFSSFNLAQAVLVLAYEWMQHEAPPPEQQAASRPATKEELHNFFNRLEQALEQAGFFTSDEIRPAMVRNLRNTLQRAEMTEQEVRTWHGVVSALIGK